MHVPIMPGSVSSCLTLTSTALSYLSHGNCPCALTLAFSSQVWPPQPHICFLGTTWCLYLYPLFPTSWLLSQPLYHHICFHGYIWCLYFLCLYDYSSYPIPCFFKPPCLYLVPMLLPFFPYPILSFLNPLCPYYHICFLDQVWCLYYYPCYSQPFLL